MKVEAKKKKLRSIRPGTSRRGASGQASVEFILSITLLLLFIFGLVELLTFAYTISVLGDAAKEGVRVAIVRGADYSPSSGQNGPSSGAGSSCPNATSTTAPDVYSAVQNTAKASFHDVSGMTVDICYPDKTNAVPSRVLVQVSYPYKPLLGLGWGWATVTLRTQAAGRIAY
jgi:Flp pilus assembly protein TadG